MTPRTAYRKAGAIALLACLLALPAAAQVPEGRHEASLSVLEYHPYPDPDAAAGLGGDPFGVEAHPRAPQDRMALYYDAYWFPTTVVDGVVESAPSQENPFRDTETVHRAYERMVLDRLREDTPLVVNLSGEVSGGEGRAVARFVPTASVASDRVAFRIVVFEDDVHFDGGNGVTNHRFLVRAVLEPEHAPVRAGESVTVERAFDVSDEWDPRNLGLVAFAQNEDADAAQWRAREVLQSATYLFRQDGPTVQVRKAALLEMYTATWCPPCRYGDEAVDLLAEEYGIGSAPPAAERWTYYRPPAWPQVALALALALALGLVLWPRRSREEA